jgi:hypothetical protein
MACKFYIPYTESITDLLKKGIQEAREFNGVFNANEQFGDFKIPAFNSFFTGRYLVNETTIEVIISDKPFIVPCVLIEKFLKTHIK